MNPLQALLSSSAVPISLSSKLRVDVFNISSGPVTCTLIWTLLDENGILVPNAETFIAAASIAPTTKTFALTKGQLLTVTLRQADVQNEYGQLYGRIQVQEGSQPNLTNTSFLSSGYMIGFAPVTFPSFQNQNPYTPAGNVMTVFGSAPAAGAQLSFSPPLDLYARLIGFAISFVASAAVANRTVRFSFEFNGTLYNNIADRTVITAGQTRNLIGWKGPNLPTDDANNHYIPLADSFEGRGLVISTTTTNMDIADQFGAPQVSFNANVAPA